jgi:hypothetical protein
MNENPTVPPKSPNRPAPKPNKIPPVKETTVPFRHYVDPYRDISRNVPSEPPKRQPSRSELDLEVVRHEEQIRSLERRVGTTEATITKIDQNVDEIKQVLAQESYSRDVKESIKEEAKIKEDQKTKRYQALFAAIPLILAPILGFYASYMSKEPPQKHEITTVVVSDYTQEAADCEKTQKSKEEFEQCIRNAQLKNTPVFRK